MGVVGGNRSSGKKKKKAKSSSSSNNTSPFHDAAAAAAAASGNLLRMGSDLAVQLATAGRGGKVPRTASASTSPLADDAVGVTKTNGGVSPPVTVAEATTAGGDADLAGGEMGGRSGGKSGRKGAAKKVSDATVAGLLTRQGGKGGGKERGKEGEEVERKGLLKGLMGGREGQGDYNEGGLGLKKEGFMVRTIAGMFVGGFWRQLPGMLECVRQVEVHPTRAADVFHLDFLDLSGAIH